MNAFVEITKSTLQFVRAMLPIKKLPAAARIFLSGMIIGILLESVCFGLALTLVKLVIAMLK